MIDPDVLRGVQRAMTRRKRAGHMSRRDFLGVAGMAAVGGGISCIGSVLGYLVLDRLSGPKRAGALPPTPDPNRGARVKQIDRPYITTRAEWNAREPNHDADNEKGFYSADNPEGWREYTGDLRLIYRTVVVHHSVIIEGDDPSTMREIQDQHMDLRKWADIGYHFGVGRSGQVFEGRDLKVRGTHVQGYNTGSVGVVFFGDFDLYSPTPEQIDAGTRLIDWLALRLELTHLAGHRDFNPFTECPGTAMLPYLSVLAESAGLLLGTGGYQPEETPTTAPPDSPVAG
jgi:hypothetical protein